MVTSLKHSLPIFKYSACPPLPLSRFMSVFKKKLLGVISIHSLQFFENIIISSASKVITNIFIAVVYNTDGGYSAPKYLWPLGDQSYAYEVGEGNGPSSDHSQCGFYFAGSHPSFSYVPLALDNNVRPYVDITVGSANTFDKVSFSIAIKPDISSYSGAIMHYRANGGSDVTDIKVYLSGGYIKMKVFNSYTTYFYGNVTDNSSPVVSGIWSLISVVRKYSSGQLEIVKDGTNIVSLDDSFPNDIPIDIPGIFRIGGSFDNDMQGFIGGITCLNWFDYEIKASETSQVLQACIVANWSNNPSGKHTCHAIFILSYYCCNITYNKRS